MRCSKFDTQWSSRSETLDNDGFTLCDSPISPPAACEGTTTLFEVDYFEGEKAYLTQSGQLYKRGNGGGVWEGLLFWSDVQGEKSKTLAAPDGVLDGRARNGVRTLEDVMNLSERMLSYIAARGA